jgi:hypothetical protein
VEGFPMMAAVLFQGDDDDDDDGEQGRAPGTTVTFRLAYLLPIEDKNLPLFFFFFFSSIHSASLPVFHVFNNVFHFKQIQRVYK